MDSIFDNQDEHIEKINLDQLYDRRREIDILRLQVYQTILQRIHKKIKITSRLKYNDPYIFYIIPEFVIGVPRYDVKHCTLYVIDKLEKNGFITKYTHPNMLFISWKHYIPSYQRDIIKEKYGVKIDGFGNKIKTPNPKQIENNPKQAFMYKDISTYKPKGIYDI